MGTADQGSKVVFVVDASGSMLAHNAIQVAKNAVVSSLRALEENQQFLIIFYDDKPTVIHLRDTQEPQLYPATELHKTLARQKIARIQPGAGTQHVPALEMALRLRPDLIFFLTDCAGTADLSGGTRATAEVELAENSNSLYRIRCGTGGFRSCRSSQFPENAVAPKWRDLSLPRCQPISAPMTADRGVCDCGLHQPQSSRRDRMKSLRDLTVPNTNDMVARLDVFLFVRHDHDRGPLLVTQRSQIGQNGERIGGIEFSGRFIRQYELWPLQQLRVRSRLFVVRRLIVGLDDARAGVPDQADPAIPRPFAFALQRFRPAKTAQARFPERSNSPAD